MVSNTNIRKSNFEILRIIAMISIIFCHYNAHADFLVSDIPFGANRIILDIVGLGGNFGNLTFVLLAGYFGYNREFSIEKALRLWSQIFFYSAGLYLLCCIVGTSTFSAVKALKAFVPIIFNQYWFMTVYIVLYFLTPFLNKLISCITMKENFTLLGILLFTITIVGTFKSNSFWYSNLALFVMLYLIGGSFAKYYEFWNRFDKRKILLLGCACYVFMALTIVMFEVAGTFINESFYNYTGFFTKMYKLPMVLGTSAIFLFVAQTTVKTSNVINSIAKCVFGVYLIHDNIYFRDILWYKLFC